MAEESKGRKIGGWVITGLVAAAMIAVGSSKIFGFAPEEIVDNMTKINLDDNLKLIGALEVGCAILLLIPITSQIGTLLCCSFWGGAIVAHLSLNDGGYTPAVVFCSLVWVSAFLRNPSMFSRLIDRSAQD